jgi:hypothetical protein
LVVVAGLEEKVKVSPPFEVLKDEVTEPALGTRTEKSEAMADVTPAELDTVMVQMIGVPSSAEGFEFKQDSDEEVVGVP